MIDGRNLYLESQAIYIFLHNRLLTQWLLHTSTTSISTIAIAWARFKRHLWGTSDPAPSMGSLIALRYGTGSGVLTGKVCQHELYVTDGLDSKEGI